MRPLSGDALTDEAVLRAAPKIETSLKRSNPRGDTLIDVLDAIADGDARLWLSQKSAAVSTLVTTVRITAEELIWHAGSDDLEDLLKLHEEAAEICAAVGVHRLVITNTRKGWARALKPLGYQAFSGLYRDL
ncbi:MAG: hypothetical protein AAGK02_08075 [Pseudomonadota bacterium]